jgi:uncharacterized Tic20 family protein
MFPTTLNQFISQMLFELISLMFIEASMCKMINTTKHEVFTSNTLVMNITKILFSFAYLPLICITMKYKSQRKKENEGLMAWVNNDLGFKQRFEKPVMSFI